MTFRLLLPILCLLALIPAPATASPTNVDTLALAEYRIALSADTTGDAFLRMTLVLAGAGPGDVLLPFGFARPDSFRIAGRDVAFPADAAGSPAPLRPVAGRRLLALTLGPAAAAGDTVVVRCRLPAYADWEGARGEFGAYDVAETFVNDSDLDIGLCRLVLETPPGYRVRRFTETEPAFKPTTSPVPPYVVGRAGDHGYAMVTAKRLRPGGRVRLGIQAERARRGPVPLVAGALMAVLYLWFFRDILPARRSAASAAQAPTGDR
jgi:hypothetical protein